MGNEDERSGQMANFEKLNQAMARREAKQAAVTHLSEKAAAAAEAQRKGMTPHDLEAKGRYAALKLAEQERLQALTVAQKRRAAEEAGHIKDLKEALEAEAAASKLEAERAEAAAAYKARAKEEMAALRIATKEWRAALDLFERRGETFKTKSEFVSRLQGGCFKLIDGELRWRDEDFSSGWWEAADPRHHMQDLPLLKALLAPGSVKPWQWLEEDRPEPPIGFEEAEANEKGGESAGEEPLAFGSASPLAGTSGGRTESQWALGQAYS